MRKGSFILSIKLLIIIFLEDNTGIVSAKAESVAHSGAHGALLCLVECEIEIIVYFFVLVVFFVVDCRRYDVF